MAAVLSVEKLAPLPLLIPLSPATPPPQLESSSHSINLISLMPQAPLMDRRLCEAILKGDVPAFLSLVEEDEHVVDQKPIPGSSSTILHIASRFGHVDLAKEIVRRRPELMSEENEKKETPLHEACREGKMEMVRLLVEEDPWLVCQVNQANESALAVACEKRETRCGGLSLEFPRAANAGN
ncbi:ANKYRIN REPEAT FAMILY PROTEIN [Salix purpurea]|uniref:ANKYRIN REPEAT FAMILY PROTEIN n=1 Tax=Salix purpurea TaxID=77065 RepID=A0A9Q0ULR2_SALPP|nr:ANKYRIN REPEAT FAMILY PROTEIN [Salix purpurea]